MAVAVIPSRIMARGPQRSIIQPWIGPSSPDSTRVTAEATPNSVADHMNSSLSAAA